MINCAERDIAILEYLEKFKVMTRDQIAALTCSHSKNPAYIATRVCRRLGMLGYITVVERPIGQQYIYGSKPMQVHPNSEKLRHHLAFADLYIQLGSPDHFEVEPEGRFNSRNNHYRPDVYTTINGREVCVEIQLTQITKNRMQAKVDGFQRTYMMGIHKAKTLWIYSNLNYKVNLKYENLGLQIIQGLQWPF